MKRLIVCCDGTWNDRHRSKFSTNPAKILEALLPHDHNGIEQRHEYIRGIGTDHWLEWLPGGAFGWGIDDDILHGYSFISQNYTPGDEIYLFGFSRGAYTVRSLAGFIYCSGLLKPAKLDALKKEAYQLYRSQEIKPSHPKAVAFRQEHGDRIPITLLGCWDTVGSLGVPDVVPLLPFNGWINEKYRFHDTELSAIIQTAYHAVAIDERLRALDITPMMKSKNSAGQDQVVKQIWFPGVHGCIGGGKRVNRGLSDAALLWMIEEASQLGLALDPNRIKDGVKPDHTARFNYNAGILQFSGLIDRDIQKHEGRFEDLHHSTKNRWRDAPDYRPYWLRRLFEQLLNDYASQSQ